MDKTIASAVCASVLFGNVEHLLLLFQPWPGGGGRANQGGGRLGHLEGEKSSNGLRTLVGCSLRLTTRVIHVMTLAGRLQHNGHDICLYTANSIIHCT